MEGGMPLPWWEFNPADFSSPSSVAQPDHDSDEALLRGFLRAGALAETAACFLSGTVYWYHKYMIRAAVVGYIALPLGSATTSG